MTRINQTITTTNDTYITLFDKLEEIIVSIFPTAIVEEDQSEKENNSTYVRRKIRIDSVFNIILRLSIHLNISKIEMIFCLNETSCGVISVISGNFSLNSTLNNNIIYFEIIYSEKCFKMNDIYYSSATRNNQKIKIIYDNQLNIKGEAEDSEAIISYYPQKMLEIPQLYNNEGYLLQQMVLTTNASTTMGRFVCDNIFYSTKRVPEKDLYKDTENNNYYAYDNYLFKF